MSRFGPRGSKPSAGEVERSGKQGYCAAFNEALPVQQQLETLPKVCALAFAFSTAHIQRAALHCAQRYTAPSVAQRAALHSAQRYTGPHAAPSEEWGFGLAPNCRMRTLTFHFWLPAGCCSQEKVGLLLIRTISHYDSGGMSRWIHLTEIRRRAIRGGH